MTKRTGLYAILIAVVISGLANFLNKTGLTIVGRDPYQYTTLKNIIAALILTVLFALPIIWPQIKKVSVRDWLKLLGIGLIGGSLPFLLYFKGLSLTTAVSASFIHKTLFVWIALLAWPLLKEKISAKHFIALAVLFGGNMIFEGFHIIKLGYPELLILAAVLMWSVEAVVAKLLLKNINPIILAWSRMFFGSLMLIIFLFFTGHTTGMLSLNGLQLEWLALVGILLAGYVFFWYSALKILPINTTACILVLASPLTTLINAVSTGQQITLIKLSGLILMLLAITVIYILEKNKQYAHASQSA